MAEFLQITQTLQASFSIEQTKIAYLSYIYIEYYLNLTVASVTYKPSYNNCNITSMWRWAEGVGHGSVQLRHVLQALARACLRAN